MTQRSFAYDNPSYLARQSAPLGATVAGAGALTSKFVAFAALQVYAVAAALITAGTSTATAYNGTATTTAVNGDSFSLVHVFGGNGVASSTATHGPFSLSYGAVTGTMTGGVFTSIPLSGAGVTGTVQAGAAAATGGVVANPGDILYVVRGADATAVSVFALEYGVQPLASVTA